MLYKINKKLLMEIKRNKNKCLCNLKKVCPCTDFLYKDECSCGVYKKSETKIDSNLKGFNRLKEVFKNFKIDKEKLK